MDQHDFPALAAQINPHAALGEPSTLENISYLAHDQAREWPWRGSILALHVARFFSIFLGAVTVWACFQTLRLLLGDSRALLGTALVAFIPQFIFISGAVSNDNAMNATAALLLWRLVALVRAPPASPWQQPRPWLLIGLLLGLALLSKLTGLALVPLVGLALLLVAWRARAWSVLWQGAILVGGDCAVGERLVVRSQRVALWGLAGAQRLGIERARP